MKIKNKQVAEEVENIKWWWLLLDKWVQLLEINFFIGVLFYCYNKTNLVISKFMGFLCLGVYIIFIFKLITLMINIINKQKKIGKIKKKLYKLLFITIILILIGLFFYTALMLADTI